MFVHRDRYTKIYKLLAFPITIRFRVIANKDTPTRRFLIRKIWGHGTSVPQPSSIRAGVRALSDYPLHETTQAILTPL